MVALLFAGAVGALGSRWVAGDGEVGVWMGAGVGAAVQVVGFWVLFVWIYPARQALAHGLGMLVRFAALGIVALVWLPRAGLPAAPTLFSLATVLFLTTLAEPVILQRQPSTMKRTTTVGGALGTQTER